MMQTMEDKLNQQIDELNAENAVLKEQLEVAYDAIDFLLMGGEE